MAKKKEVIEIPDYPEYKQAGKVYYRTRITDADGKQMALYDKTREGLYQKVQEAKIQIEDELFRRANPTVKEYCEKWLTMKSATISKATLRGYTNILNKHVIRVIGDKYMDEVTADDLKSIMVPLSKLSKGTYATAHMILKCVFASAEMNEILTYNPSETLPWRGGVAGKERQPLTDEQVSALLKTVKGLPPYVFVMIGLYSGLRREEILALKWDCVFLDAKTPYISVRRAWRSENNRPTISRVLKTPAAKRDVPIPGCLVQCLREAKAKSKSEFVIAASNGQPLAYTQFQRVWKYIVVRTAGERSYWKYVNGEKIKVTIHTRLGEHQKNNPKIVYSLDFEVTPHMLRHTYITNLIHKGVDPKTVQYLAGHENSKVTMDIYAKVKYNKPEELTGVVNAAFGQNRS